MWPRCGTYEFILNEVAGLAEICALPGNEECSVELVESILDEASNYPPAFSIPSMPWVTVRAPSVGQGNVTTSPGFKDHRMFVDTG